MKNQTIVKVLAVLIGQMFLMCALNGSANPKIDLVASHSAQSHDTHSYSYYENKSSISDLLSADRHLDITVYDDATKQPMPNANISLVWNSHSTWTSNIGLGAIQGAIIGAIVLGVILAILSFGTTLPITAGTIFYGAMGGALAGGVIGGFASSQQKDVSSSKSEPIELITDADGKAHYYTAWQDDVSITLYISPETLISGYSDFKPMGNPHWEGGDAKNRMYCDIYMVGRSGEGTYLNNLRIAQNKVGNLTYVETEDLGQYQETANFKPLNMHTQANADLYSEECGRSEWGNTGFWDDRITVYPDGKGSDILWVESRRLVYIKDLSGVTSFTFNVTYKDGNNKVINQGKPAGAIELDSNYGTKLGKTAGKYWYYQWVWVVGKADLENPTIEIDAGILVNGALPLVKAGFERVTIPDEQHIITFTFSDSGLISKVHHTVYAERGIPTVHGDLRFNFYSYGDDVRVQAMGIQSLPEEWDTGEYGIVDLVYPTCSYKMYFTIEDNAGNVIESTTPTTYNFKYDTMTSTIAYIPTDNITMTQSHKLSFYNSYYGDEALMSSTLFYQLEDYDNHYNLTEQFEALLEDTFKITGTGGYANFDNAHVNAIMNSIESMNSKIATHQQRLDDFIDNNGENNYTGQCQKMIDYFHDFYNWIQKYSGKTATDISADGKGIDDFRALSYALMISFNHAYLYYSCAVAFANGDLELATDLSNMMQYEDNLLEQYHDARKGADTWDLTLLVILIICLIVASIVTYGSYKYYVQQFHTPDKQKMAMLFGGIFAGSFVLTFAILYFFFFGALEQMFGHIARIW